MSKTLAIDLHLSQIVNTVGDQLGISDDTDPILLWALDSIICKTN